VPQALNSDVKATEPSTARLYASTSSVIMSITPSGCGGRHMVGVSSTSYRVKKGATARPVRCMTPIALA
jgi:hypothetical protein